jgi:transmembrane sensor
LLHYYAGAYADNGNYKIMNEERREPVNYQVEDFVTDESFINYFFRLNADDEIFWNKWVKDHPANNKIVNEAKDIIRNLSLALSDNEYNQELQKIKKVINYEQGPSVQKKPVLFRPLQWAGESELFRNKRKKFAKFFFPVLLIFITGGYFYVSRFKTEPGLSAEKYNNTDKPIVFSLSDSTVVTLAPQAKLRYPLHFDNKERKVLLDGEAQFHVFRDEAHPFKVYEGDIIATVLGTVFNIKKQSGDSVILVELLKGKLKVEAVNSSGLSSQSIILNPDERVIYMSHGQKLLKEKWQSQNDVAMQVNHLVFHQNNFNEIAAQIKNVFGVILINQSNKKNFRFTGEFTNTSAKEIIENICLVEGLNSQASGDSILIR